MFQIHICIYLGLIPNTPKKNKIEKFYGELNRIMKITEKRINKHKDMLTGIIQSSLYFDKNISHQV